MTHSEHHGSGTATALLAHCRNLIRKGKFVQGRISRGEYWVSYLSLVVISSIIGTVLRHVAGSIGELIASVIGIIFSIFQIKLIIKRSHDIGENAWYSFIPLFVMLGIGLLSVAILPRVLDTQGLFTDGAAFQSFLTAWPSLVAGGLLLITFIWLIVRSCKLIFQKGSNGENSYGVDPLSHQSTSNKRYRVLGCAMVLISIVASALGKPIANSTYDTIDPTATDSIGNTKNSSTTLLDYIKDNKSNAKFTCHQAAEKLLKAPSTAKFAPISEVTITANNNDSEIKKVFPNNTINDNTFTLVSYVDAQNGFGAQIRSNIICLFERNIDTNDANLINIVVE